MKKKPEPWRHLQPWQRPWSSVWLNFGPKMKHGVWPKAAATLRAGPGGCYARRVAKLLACNKHLILHFINKEITTKKYKFPSDYLHYSNSQMTPFFRVSLWKVTMLQKDSLEDSQLDPVSECKDAVRLPASTMGRSPLARQPQPGAHPTSGIVLILGLTW